MAGKALRWERRPDDRPHELLEAALKVFAENGYRNTRLDDVAEAAGVTKGTIYHYFDTKEELLLSAIEHYQALAFGRVEGVLQDVHLPASTRIRLLVRKMFSVRAPSSRYLLALLVRAAAHEVRRVHDTWLRDGPVKLWGLIAQLVEEGKDRGEFRPDADGDAGARLLVSGLMLQLIWQQHAAAVPALAIDEDRLIDSTVELFLAGLRSSAPPIAYSSVD
ncbi:MAG: TetR/AcrR family transcriptional regulator [Gemmatimonadetes bacterium]|nr:TetR/AcrR family transcriptional regulator [Gemmatimonadota bacterium]